MKLNINKDKLLKNKFWIMLGIAVPLIFGSLFILLDSVSAENAKAQSKALATLKKSSQYPRPYYNDKNIAEMIAQVTMAQNAEYKKWGEVYELQTKDNSLFWPAALEKNYPIHTGKFLRELKYLGGDFVPVADDKNHVTGKLVTLDNPSISIRVKGAKDEVQIFRMANEEMKLDGKEYFKLPVDKDVQATFQIGWYFNDKLTQEQQAEYVASYASQIRPLLEIVDPINEEGEGVVQLLNWPMPKKNELPPRNAKFLRFVTPPWRADADISHEAWMAQEDLWIQKEIYRLIRQANDYVGKMKGTAAKGIGQVATYENPYFELKLKLLDKNRLEATIKNLQNYRQKLDVKFRVRFTAKGFDPEKITIEGEPLDPKGTKDAKGLPKDTLTKVISLENGTPRELIADVEQVLTWETAAVRRIDDIVIGAGDEIALNHRTFPDNVKPFGPEPKREMAPGAPGAPPGGPPAGVPPAGVPPDGVPPPMRGMPGMMGGDGLLAVDRAVNGLVKARYCEETTEQTRRIPVAISLIVDQDHIDRVLTSFGNSKFRFLLNQVLINRYPLSVRPVVSDKNAPKGLPGQLPPRFGIGMPPAAMGGDDEMEANVELVIYGTMTLYQRFPQRRFLEVTKTP